MNTPVQVVVAYYDRRPVEQLYALLDSMQLYCAGENFAVCIIVNCSSDNHSIFNLNRFSELDIAVHYRPNLGMNIGAWDAGWRLYPQTEHFLFLQYDCYVVRDGWLIAFVNKLNEANVGLVGECINQQWDCNWDELHAREANTELPEHLIDGKPANRVDVYRQFMQQHNISPGDSGAHLRALSWAASRTTLQAIDGFPVGKNFGECIASEIGVNRHISQHGLSLQTVAENPFHYIRHSEWNQSEPGGEFNKHNVGSTELKRLKQENQRLSSSLETVDGLLSEPGWKLARGLISGKLKTQIASALGRK